MSESLVGSDLTTGSGSKGKSPMKMAVWGATFLGLIFFFTLLKLPNTKITDFIQGKIQSTLDPMGIYISSRERDLKFFPKLEYRLDHPVIELSEQTRIELDDLAVSPSFLRALTGALGASAILHQGKGELSLEAGMRTSSIDLKTQLSDIDLAKIGAFSFAGIKGSGSLGGTIHLGGAPADFTAMTGDIDLRLRAVNLEEQSIYGLKIPEVQMAEGTVAGELKSGKLTLKNVVLGRQTDDIFVSASGDITLNRNLNSSQLNLRVSLAFSQKIKSALSFIDMMLSASRQKDGRYVFRLSGPLGQPTLLPETGN